MSANNEEVSAAATIIDIERRQDEVLLALDQLEQRIAALLQEYAGESAAVPQENSVPKAA